LSNAIAEDIYNKFVIQLEPGVLIL